MQRAVASYLTFHTPCDACSLSEMAPDATCPWALWTRA